MAIVHGYTDLATMKLADNLGITNSNSDASIEAVVNSVSRAIDDYTNRYFWPNAAPEIRYFTPEDEEYIYVGDLISLTSLLSDDGNRTYPYTWTTTDYDLWPYNNALDNVEPYHRIDITPNGTRRFRKGLAKGVKITGTFGWTTAPYPIIQACIQWSLRAFMRLQTPLGSKSTTALGAQTVKVPPPDPDVMQMLDPYALVVFG